MTADREALEASLLAFISSPEDGAFEHLAQRVVAYQRAHIEPYDRLCRARRYDGARWEEAPLVPTTLFRELDLCTASSGDDVAVFKTSGTTGSGARGYRRVPSLRLYHAAMTEPFIANILNNQRERRPWLSLIPRRHALPESSLSHMVSKLGEDLASSNSLWSFKTDGLDVESSWTWLEETASAGQPIVILTTSFALVTLLDAAPKRDVMMPPGSRMMLTGGFKGRSRTIEEGELFETLESRLGLAYDAVVPEYGMTELTSQAYGRPFLAPPWLKLRVVDPLSHRPLNPGATGLVAFFDLLNLDNISAIVTSDMGQMTASEGLILEGRAPGSILRGCSLTAESLGLAS